MLKKIKIKNEIFALGLLILITVIFTSYYNHTKKKIEDNYKDVIHNVYFKKSINYFFDNLEPKFKKVTHKLNDGETLSSILENYSINENEIENINKELSKKINLNKLKTNQKVHFIIDQSKGSIKEFVFQISNHNCTTNR